MKLRKRGIKVELFMENTSAHFSPMLILKEHYRIVFSNKTIAGSVNTLCDKIVFFVPLLSRNFNDQLSSNFHRFVILCICWDTASVKTGL